MLRPALTSLLLLLAMTAAGKALARPEATGLFCAATPDAPACSGSAISCTYCHQAVPPALNPFGADLAAWIYNQNTTFPADTETMRSMLTGTESADSDGDGIANKDEIAAGSLPGNKDGMPKYSGCSDAACGGDPLTVYKRIWLSVCGEPADFAATESFSALSPEAQQAKLVTTMDDCLDSENWIGKDGVVWEIGHYKIRPVGSVKFGEDAGIIPIVDYYNDYEIFVWTQTNDHDARDILLADYTVTRNIIGNRTFYNKDEPSRMFDGQIMQPEYRIGLLTTFWNMGFYLNYTAVARVLVAQAFNAYLGINLSLMQGINPPPVEESRFRDYDLKGVEKPECARCHTTIDPLAYPFRNYNGLTGTSQVLAGQNAQGLTNLANLGDEENLTPLSYARPRMDFLDQKYPGIKDMPEAGYIFGKRVENLREWAEVLVNSDQFAANTVRDYWKVLIGSEPTTDQMGEFRQLWTNFKNKHDFRVEAMLHDMIRTKAFGRP
jgi:hypothetical protein